GGLSFIFGYQLIRIVSDMNAIQDQLKHGLEEILVFLDEHIPYFDLPADQESMNAMIGKLLEAPFRFAGSGISSGAAFLVNAALAMIYTIFLLIYKEAFKDFLLIQFPKDKREEIASVLSQSVHLIQRYLAGMVTVIIILAILNCIGLMVIG